MPEATDDDYKPINVNDHETPVEWLNKLAREAPEDRPFPEGYRFEDVYQLGVRVREEAHDRTHGLEIKTNLSAKEAEVVALKELGLTHSGVALATMKDPSGAIESDHMSKSTVDEHSRRARVKFNVAKVTAEELEGTYGTGGE